MLEEQRSILDGDRITGWSPEERAEAAKSFRELIAILRKWDDEERMERARRVVEAASSER